MDVGLSGLVHADLARHVLESRSFYAAEGERRGPASLEELRAARAQHGPAQLSEGVTVEQVGTASGRKIQLRIFAPRTSEVLGLRRPRGGSHGSRRVAHLRRPAWSTADAADRRGVGRPARGQPRHGGSTRRGRGPGRSPGLPGVATWLHPPPDRHGEGRLDRSGRLARRASHRPRHVPTLLIRDPSPVRPTASRAAAPR